MTTEVASPLSRHPLPGVEHPPSMAALMQSNNESVAISNPLPAPSTAAISSQPESLTFVRQSRPESSLSSIASAGLHISRSGESLSQAPNPSSAGVDHPMDPKPPMQNSSQVAREALGASEKPQGGSRDSIPMPDQMQVDSQSGTGNVSDAFGTTENNASLIHTSTVASPGPIEDSTSQDGDRLHHRDDTDIPPEADSSKAFSYPMPSVNLSESRRGLSLPDSGFHRPGQRSPSAKKHRCPYCATEFTRHHNLKSHLLTHSQEKPYVCQTCQSRFRRLHDLKRHTKLHTGERPHICPKCGRRFARGDALARHNKGQGGCAGRRASMGSYAGEDEYGEGAPPGAPEDTMEGLVYAEPERMDEEEERRLNIPGMKRHDASGPGSRTHTGSFHSRQPSTYPPMAAHKPSFGSLLQPPASHGGSSASASPISQTGNMTFPPAGHPSGASVLQPSNAAESPRPLSPNALSSHQLGNGSENIAQLHRAHSPGAAQSFQQPMGRSGPGSQSAASNHAPSGLGLPPPQPGAPQLPPPPGMNSSDPRLALNQGSMLSSGAAKHASHGHSSNPSVSASKPSAEVSPSLPGVHDPNYGDQSREDKLWGYIRSVHEELAALRTEVTALRAHVASNSSAPGPIPNTSHPPTDASSGEQR